MTGQLLTERALIVYRSGLPLLLAPLSALLAILACLWQPLTGGQDQAMSPATGLHTALLLAPAATLLTGLAVLGRDRDSGLDHQAHLTGLDTRRLTLYDTAIAALTGTTSLLVMTLTALLFAVADTTRRALLGPPAPPSPAPTTPPWLLLAAPLLILAAAVLATLLSAATGRSARLGMITHLLIIGSGIILLSLSAGNSWRPLTVWHPLGGPWALLYHGPSARLRLDTSPGQAATSTALWLTILCGAAASSRRPGRAPRAGGPPPSG